MQKVDLSKKKYDIGSKVYLIDKVSFQHPWRKNERESAYVIVGQFVIEAVLFEMESFGYSLKGFNSSKIIPQTNLFSTYKEALAECEKLERLQKAMIDKRAKFTNPN
jgi:hypothetical protein